MKNVVLSMGLMATCIYAQTPRLGKGETLLHLGRMVASVKVASVSMFAANTLRIDHDKIGEFVAFIRDSFDESQGALITYVEELEERTDLMASIELSDKINWLSIILFTSPSLPEEVEIIQLALPRLRALLTEQTLVPNEHTAGVLQIVEKMESLSSGWNLIQPPDEAQQSEWLQLVRHFAVELQTMKTELPDAFVNYEQLAQSLLQKIISDKFDLNALDTLTTINTWSVLDESYKGIVAMVKLYSTAKREVTGMTIVETLERTMGEDVHIIVATVNIEDEHFDLLHGYLSGQISSSDFAQQYREFLHKYSEFFSAEKIQEAEQKLADF